MKALLFPLILALAPFIASAAPTRAETDAQIREYILAHPEIIVESLRRMQDKEETASKEKAEKIIATDRKAVFGDETPSAGPKDARVTIVEFSDYNCGVCKQMFENVDRAVKDKSLNVRVLFKEFPIFGEKSEKLAAVALAVHKLSPDEYYRFHGTMMQLHGQPDDAAVEEILDGLDLDPNAVRKLAASDEIKAQLDANAALAERLDLRGTPAFIIGGELTPSAMRWPEFSAAIRKAAKAKATGEAG